MIHVDVKKTGRIPTEAVTGAGDGCKVKRIEGRGTAPKAAGIAECENPQVLTGNGACYRALAFAAVLAETGISHKSARPTDLSQTARSNASVGYCWRNGPTP